MAGKPVHEPTPESKQLVHNLVISGCDRDTICRVMRIGKNTLVKYYKDIIVNGKALANGRVAGALYKNAIKGNVVAQMFWLKTQLQWRETSRVEHTGADGERLNNHVDRPLPETAEQWLERRRREEITESEH